MTELIWLNGAVMPLAEARIGVEDRGFQFADGVYEVIRVYQGRAFALGEHLDRLKRSAEGISLPLPMPLESLSGEIRRLIGRSGLVEGMVYLQLTRGDAARNHAFPQCTPTLLFHVRELEPVGEPGRCDGLTLLSVPDERWKKCWIKSIALLPNVLAKNAALAAGADEAVFIDDGIVTECSSSNIFVVKSGRVATHPVGSKVLGGITREAIIAVAGAAGVAVEERPVTEAEAIMADEVFVASTTREIGWVKRWNDRALGGRCGPVTLRLHRALRQDVQDQLLRASTPSPS
jgi:D-alanine transaminase